MWPGKLVLGRLARRVCLLTRYPLRFLKACFVPDFAQRRWTLVCSPIEPGGPSQISANPY
ncbi:hypothetical protein [Myxococcus sp. AB056]|uniref:hypothetical protein n=1 Tax=Myxococcus sp. AB056 TaxID=2562792 RepID=UPI0011466722|nr:hypothetical protein [Myxococcus sp. AB056]